MDLTTFRNRSWARSRTDIDPLDPVQTRAVLYALGLAGEAGEVADLVKKHAFHGLAFDDDLRAKVLKECGDVLWYLDRVLWWVGATVEDAAAANDAKLEARYPLGWDAAEQHYGFGDQGEA